MTLIGWIQIILYCAIVVALVKPLGWYMTRVFNGERTFMSPILQPVEGVLYKIAGVDRGPRAALAHLHDCDAVLPHCRLRLLVRAAAIAGRVAVQSRRSVGGRA